MNEATEPPEGGCALPLMAAADLQDHLLMAANDLERLQTLLAGACDTLMKSFHGACDHVRALTDAQDATDDGATDIFQGLMQHLGSAVTALQFQDLASQLIHHTHQRLQSCADQVAQAAMGDEDGEAIVLPPPLRPNPVTQDEMDAGSIELF